MKRLASGCSKIQSVRMISDEVKNSLIEVKFEEVISRVLLDAVIEVPPRAISATPSHDPATPVRFI